MITYKIVNDDQYKDDILLHLRAHNTSHTGDRLKDTSYYYVFNETALQGACKIDLGWDWLGISNLYYQDKTALLTMLSNVLIDYEGKFVGIKFFTKDTEKKDDLKSIGFVQKAIVEGTPNELPNYVLEAHELNAIENSLIVINTKEELNDYKEELKEYNLEQKAKFNIKDPNESITIVALEEDEFAGGVVIQISDESTYVDLLVVREEYRGKDIGTKLMKMAENEAIKRNHYMIDLGTASFQARAFYEKLGYHVILTRKDYPKGFECYTLVKKLK